MRCACAARSARRSADQRPRRSLLHPSLFVQQVWSPASTTSPLDRPDVELTWSRYSELCQASVFRMPTLASAIEPNDRDKPWIESVIPTDGSGPGSRCLLADRDSRRLFCETCYRCLPRVGERSECAHVPTRVWRLRCRAGSSMAGDNARSAMSASSCRLGIRRPARAVVRCGCAFHRRDGVAGV